MKKNLISCNEIVSFSNCCEKSTYKTTKNQHLSGNIMYIEIDHKLVPRKIFDINDRTPLPTEEPEIDSDKELDFDEDSFGPRGFRFDRRRMNVNHNVNKEEVRKGDFNSALKYFIEQKEEGEGKRININ